MDNLGSDLDLVSKTSVTSSCISASGVNDSGVNDSGVSTVYHTCLSANTDHRNSLGSDVDLICNNPSNLLITTRPRKVTQAVQTEEGHSASANIELLWRLFENKPAIIAIYIIVPFAIDLFGFIGGRMIQDIIEVLIYSFMVETTFGFCILFCFGLLGLFSLIHRFTHDIVL